MHLVYLTIDRHGQGRGGGLATYLTLLTRELARRGHTVTVLAIGKTDHCERDPDLPLYHVEVACPNLHWYVYRGAFFERTLALPLREWEWSRAFVRGIRLLSQSYQLPPPDLIEGLELGNSRPFPAPLVIRAHNSEWSTYRVGGKPIPPGLRLDRALERRGFGRARVISAVSTAHADALRAEFAAARIGLPPLTVIPNPIDTERFAYTPSPSTPTLLYAGRLESWKGIFTLLDAMPIVREAIPTVHLTIAGSRQPSVPEQKFRDSLARLGESVHYVGHVPWTETARLYRDHAVFVIPSLYETFCIAAGEALSSGRPVVGTTAGALPEMIPAGVAGLLPPPGDIGALAEALITLLRDPVRAAAMGQAGAARVRERFRIERVADESEALYQRVANRL